MNKLVILFVIVACLSIGIDGRVYQVIDSFSQFQAALQLAPSPYGESPADYDWFSPYNTNNPPAVFIKNTFEALGGQRDSILGFKTTSSSGITARFSLLPAAGTALVAFPIGYVGASYVQWDGNDQSAGQGPSVPFPAAVLNRNPGIGSNATVGANADGRSYDFTFASAAKGLTIQITSDLDVIYTLTALDTGVGINELDLPIIGAENVTRNYYIRYDDRRWTQPAFNWAQVTAFQVKVNTNGGVSGAIDTSYRLLNIYTFELGGTVYVDCGCDSIPEGGIANLTIDLFNTTGGINILVDNTNTNATGSYRFVNFNFPSGEIIIAQTYRICIRDTAVNLCNNQNRCTDVTLSNPIIDQVTFDYYVIQPAVLSPPADVTLECGQSTATSSTGVAQSTACNGTTPVTTNSDSLNQQACVTTITRTFTDTSTGRSVTQRITVRDTQPPTFTTQPSSPTVPCGGTPTLAQYIQTNGGAQATDVCNFQGITNNYTTGGVGNCGAITIQFTARDTCGLTATAIGTYTTNDVNPPTFTTPPSPLNIECDFTTTGNNPNTRISNYLANRGNLVVSDDCTSTGAITVTNDFVATTLTPATACNYVQTVTFTARDQCNNPATASSTISVTDTIGPQITRQASDVQGQCGSGSSGNDFQSFLNNRGGATATDICSTGASDLVWTNDASGNNPGSTCGDSTTVTFTVRDQCGRTNSTSARYVIVDNTPPTITTQASNASPQCDGQGNVGDYSNFLANRGGFVASDNCGPVTYSNNAPPTGPTGCGQSVTVTFTATQQCTPVLSVTSVATYSIRDSTPPTFTTPPQSQIVECSASAPDQFQTFLNNNAGAVAADACSNQGLVIQNNNNGATINNGCANTVTVTFTARDGCGNVSPGAFASFTIRDTTAPVLTTPASDLTLTCGPTNNQDFINWRNTQGGAVATDSCTQVTWTSNDTSVISSGCNSARVVTFTASDACNNLVRTTATFRVTDNEAPTIVTQAQNAQFECNGSGNQADIQGFLNTRGGATATDNCGAVTWSNNFSALTGTCTRAATVTFVATDPCGLTSATTATISVVDNNAPTISPGASDFALECNQGTNNQAFQNYINTRGGANAFDLCQQNGTLVWTNNAVASPDGCTSAQITFTVTDPCGRSASTTGTFTIRDRTAPVITTPPRSVAVECDGSGNVNDYNSFVATNGGLVAEDNCAVRLTVTSNAPTTGPVGCGSRQVTFNVADLCGNSVSTQAIFTVYDSQAPVFTVLPTNVTQECARRNDTSPFQDWLRTRGGAQAVDVCSGGNITLSAELDELSSASKCNQYADIEFKARDACGQASSVVGRYTVVDTTAPVLLQPAVNQFLECSEATNVDDINFWILANGFASATDACTAIEWSNNFNDVYPEECQGPIAVTFTASDVCGLSVSTTATAQIDDSIAPIFLNFPRNVVITCRNATDPSVTGAPDAFDSYCDVDIVPTYTDVVRQNPNVNFCPGDTIIERTWTITDDCGNFNTRTQIITQTVPEGPCSFTPCPPCGTTNVCCDSTREAVPCNPVPCNSVPCRPVQCSSVPCTPRSCGNGTPLYDDDDVIDPTPLPTRAPGQNCEPVYVYVYDDDDAVNPPQTNNQSAQSASSLLTVTFTVLLAAIFLLV